MVLLPCFSYLLKCGSQRRAYTLLRPESIAYALDRNWVGLAFLRRGWINLDLVWVLALIGAEAILLVFAVW
jgi:hypothetical protein